MSERSSRPRTLLVGPIGPRPWVSRNELIAQLDDLGHEVLINGVNGPEIVTSLETMPARVGVARNSLPSLFVWFARMIWRWRRASFSRLREAKIDHILVWDPILAGLCRLARPSGTEVIWVAARSDGVRLYQRLLRAALSMSADRVVVSWEGDARWARGPVTLTRSPMPLEQNTAKRDEWVLLATARPPTPQALEQLARRAEQQPARAVLFDSRGHDNVAPQLAELLRETSGADAVWWAAADEWLQWFDGMPAEAVEVSDTFAVDHRHLRVLGAGGSLLVPDDTPDGLWSQLLYPVKTHDGWTHLAVREDVSLPSSEADWAAQVFAPAPPTAEELVSAHGRAVERCPMCHATERKVVGTTDGGTTALFCLHCGLTYASHVLPDAILSDASYHTGGSAFGTDYQSEVIRGLVEEVADHRLDVLEELGITGGRLLDVGAGLGHMVRRAIDRGWEAEGIDIVPEACSAARRMYDVTVHPGTIESVGDIGRFDVVCFGQTLEHLPDPVAALRYVRENLLVPGGRVFIEAPNAKCLARVLQRRRWMHWQPGDHHTYPDIMAMKQMFLRAGFRDEVVRSDSLTIKDASELVLAYNLGLVSDRTSQVFPPTARLLAKYKTYNSLRRLTAAVDKRGWGQNVVAVGVAEAVAE